MILIWELPLSMKLLEPQGLPALMCDQGPEASDCGLGAAPGHH
jgi:hypothetical protein